MIQNILLDLDGVIVDFIGGFRKWYNIPNTITTFPGDYDMTPEKYGLDMTIKEMWQGLSYDFWINLEFTPEAENILKLVHDLNTTILTSPSSNGVNGKQEWIKKNMSRYFYKKKYLIGPDKSACAHPGALLIDDSDHKVAKFRKAGGHAILFPQHWNAHHSVVNKSVFFEVCLASHLDQ